MISKKKIWLVGSRGAGKTELLNSLVELGWTTAPNGLQQGISDLAIGDFADYRTELWLASNRAVLDRASNIYESTLIDSVAYTALRYAYILNNGTGTDEDALRWMITMHTCASMLRDSFDADAVVWVPGSDGTSFAIDLGSALTEVMFSLPEESTRKFALSEDFTPLQRAEEFARIVEALDGPGYTDKKSSGEDN